MKRPAMTISGRAVSPSELRTEVKEASLAWLRDNREAKATKKRRHRALSEAEREAKAQATAVAKKKRADERDARELERLLQRVGYLSKRSAKEAEAMTRVRVRVQVASAPRFRTVCSRSLYSRLHDEVSQRKDGATKRSRVAADGYKNIVLRKHSRGFGRKTIGARGYRMGEAADLVRYILRDEGLEPEIQATFTNVIEFKGVRALFSSELPVIEEKRASQIAAFWNALEILESEADADGNVFSHLILAMPHELSSEGRSEALSDFCLTLRSLQLPYVAALHKPDADGDARNYHAHILLSPRPFEVEGPLEWSFEAAKATELNLPCGISWLRDRAAESFNRVLEEEARTERYSGLSQAKRGVPSTGEAHDGPALTARKRRADNDGREQERLLQGLTAQVADKHSRQRQLSEQIDKLSAAEIPSALATLQERFPNPRRLRGLTYRDILTYSEQDREADQWYAPALALQAELKLKWRSVIEDDEGRPRLKKSEIAEPFRTFAAQKTLPDIVEDTIVELHRRLIDEREARKEDAAAKEKEEFGKYGHKKLKEPIPVFTEEEYLRLREDQGRPYGHIKLKEPIVVFTKEEYEQARKEQGRPVKPCLAHLTRGPSDNKRKKQLDPSSSEAGASERKDTSADTAETPSLDNRRPKHENPLAGLTRGPKPKPPSVEDGDDDYQRLLRDAVATGKIRLSGKGENEKD
ncbi:MobA/MobL family plasmid mobilization protein [Erythrobacter sp. SD-21]|nr:MobA/MobL family plasmid mobilization protein [Erythrobacter sp. SD-21]